MSATKAPMWPEEPLPLRLDRCRSMLVIHGMLSERESDRCRKRIIASIKELQKILDEIDKTT
jgi:hypothetical protein